MASPLPPDPYAALGLTKAATAAEIKTAYRKLALKCHPDKVTDPSQKADKAAEFHKIQQAYEILGDDDKRERYNAQVRLAELRKEAMERQSRSSPNVEVRRDATYEIRTPGNSYARGRAYEEPRSRAPAYDQDDRFYDDPRTTRRSGKYTTPRDSRRASSPPRTSGRERVKATPMDSDYTRSAKSRDQDKRRDRTDKYSYADDDDSDERDRVRYEDRRRRKHQEEMYAEEERRKNAELRREAERLREKAEADRRETLRKDSEDAARRATKGQREDPYGRGDPVRDKYAAKHEDAVDYMKRAQRASPASVDDRERESSRPSNTRSSSSYEQVRHRGSERPAVIRRTSDRPGSTKDRILDGTRYGSGSRRDRDRKGAMPEIVEEVRIRPPLEKFDSSPAAMKAAAASPRAPERSATTDFSYTRDPSPPHPSMRRAETMPNPIQTSSARRESAKPNTSSKLRNESTLHDSGYSSPNTPTASDRENQYPTSGTTTKTYRYPEGGVKVPVDDYRTIVVEPPINGSQKRSANTSPIRERVRRSDSDRDERGRDRASRPQMTTRYYTIDPTRTGLGRNTSATRAPRVMSPERERERGRGRDYDEYDRKRDPDFLYGEIPKRAGEPLLKRPDPRRGDSYTKDDVSYSHRIGPDDIRWAPKSKTMDRDEYDSYYKRPPMAGLSRGYTTVN